jgi:hypothetical protein
MKKYLPIIASLFMVAVASAFGWTPTESAIAAVAIGMAMPQDFPDLASFKAYMVNQPGVMEVVKWSLYDTAVYPTAGVLNLDFFQTQVGQGFSASTGNAGNPKALADTNMDGGGFLPAPQGFWIETIELIATPGSSAATVNTFVIQPPTNFAVAAAAAVQAGAHDVNAILTTGSLRLTVGTKPYLIEAPLYRLPPWCRMRFDWALATSSGTVGETTKDYMRADGEVYAITPGIPLPSMQNFKVSLQWPALVATPSTNNAKIQVILDGWLFRAVQ